MKEGHFIGLNDRTTCGGKVLDGDTRIMMYGVAHARDGDRVTCGKDGETYRIVGGISHMISHGKPMAGTLDSYSNCPCKARLIPSVMTATYQSNASPAQAAARVAGSSAAPAENSFTVKPQVVDLKLADKISAPPGDLGGSEACNHPDQMEELASYIAGEMNRNIKHPSVLKMKELMSYDSSAQARKFRALPWYARLAGPPNFNGIAWTKKLEAMAIWTKQVGQNREWDHKPKLRELFPGVRHKQGKYLYYYDIWSNIHYGYVGIIGGLSESLLLDGAGAEQIASDTLRKAEEIRTTPKEDRELLGPRPTASPWTELRSWDDVADRVSISIGIKLANQHPEGGISAQMIMNKVLAVPPENWGDGVRVHVCK
ncbi:polymorphic toxin type 44 domain-containing protein [Pseudomonas sp. TNT2022 ID1044]|uniref:polymorphic toxin type 44 domain-containing protein n=1 Tax=Pseudomonas sp. TNT2022 ID1044 TaxID=2942636 RepID=UPI00235F7622|nr:polymorphic toxin type 44 domain-containing protein [Pseudomonas sp. TNT2022 ID1044]MDD0994391.1 polymorphic toxin type 44 domain-containing protein [Pseudomonas sp. TNT2022 ID1044]